MRTSSVLCVLVTYDCYKKLAQTEWIETTQIYYLAVLEVRSLKWVLTGQNQGVGRGEFLLEAPEENLFPCLFQLSEGGLWSLVYGSFLYLQSTALQSVFILIAAAYPSDHPSSS